MAFLQQGETEAGEGGMARQQGPEPPAYTVPLCLGPYKHQEVIETWLTIV